MQLGGSTAAARARRLDEDCDITIFERQSNVSIATCGLPYHIEGEIIDRSKLVQATPQYLRDILALDVRTSHEVISIDRANKEVLVANLSIPRNRPGSTFRAPYDKLLIATGAAPVMPPIPGLKETAAAGRLFTLRTLKDMDFIIQRIIGVGKTGHVVVIGGGPIGLEMVEALSTRGLAVTVVEALPQIMGILDPELTTSVMDELVWRGIDVRLSSKVVSLEDRPNEDSVTINLDNGDSLSARFVLQSIGVRPESNLAIEAGLEVNERKAIIVNSHMQTSDPDIYSVGDVACTPYCEPPRQSWLPMGGAANRMARLAAEHMVLGEGMAKEGYPGSFGTCIIRVFDSVSGRTGLTEAGKSTLLITMS